MVLPPQGIRIWNIACVGRWVFSASWWCDDTMIIRVFLKIHVAKKSSWLLHRTRMIMMMIMMTASCVCGWWWSSVRVHRTLTIYDAANFVTDGRTNKAILEVNIDSQYILDMEHMQNSNGIHIAKVLCQYMIATIFVTRSAKSPLFPTVHSCLNYCAMRHLIELLYAVTLRQPT